uniref:Protein TRANSPARENT TESTA 12-like n=1 Tax=Populus alba TaxID=43335 RepID=A0A4U5PQZ2_POPAL|nr:protein TRANSPARENT TESTA 12-like [Populus alba]
MGRISINGDDLHDTLLLDDPVNHDVGQENQDPLASRVWTETKKLWEIVGPAIFSRVATFSMNIITQAFAGHLGDVELAAISIANTVIVGFNFGLLVGSCVGILCMSINGWEIMIPLAFFAATGVRVSNELGAGNGKGAKFATIVSVVQSSIVGLIFCVIIMLLHNKIALIFTSSSSVIQEVDNLSLLLAITILLNSVQPVLSGVAVGAGWQALVAYVNLGCYYIIGLPLGVLIGLVFKLGVKGIWGGMIFGGTAVQTVILVIITMRSDWDKEAEKARINVNKWSQSKPDVQ